jgi:hypothetical protein
MGNTTGDRRRNLLHLDDKGLPLEIEILDAAKLSMIDEISVSPAFGRKQEELTPAT